MEIQLGDDRKGNFKPSKAAARNMLELLHNEIRADVTFKVGDTLATAHKFIL